MSKTKVLIVCASLKIGGAEKVAQNIALYAPKEEFEFHYLVFHRSIGEYEADLLARGCCIHRLPEPSDNYLLFFRELLGLMRTHHFHVVHAHTMFNCGLVMLAAWLYRVPVRISHAHSALNNGNSLLKHIYESTMRFLILSCSTTLVACGVKAGQRLYGNSAYERRGHLILNGVDIPRFCYNEESRRTIRTSLQARDRLILGHVGHLTGVKNQAFLLNLMPQILKQHPDAMLLLLGEGDNRPMLEQKVSELGLRDHVILTGNVANVEDYLSAMDVFVFPSLFEGMPLSLLEVQANGLPCVVSDAVPDDVFLTDLIHPLSLKASHEDWVREILCVSRMDPLRYNLELTESDFSASGSVSKILQLYKNGTTADRNI